LEISLAGLKIGEKRIVSISKQEFAEVDEDFILEIVVDNIRLGTQEESASGIQ